MSYNPNNPNGQTTSGNSAPVTIASDQSQIKVGLAASQANVTGSITSATSVVTAADLTGVGSLTVQISGTHAGINVTFEASTDGTNWVAVPAVSVSAVPLAPSTTSGVLVSNSLNIWTVSPLLGLAQFRVRATSWTSGTGAVIIDLSAQFVQYLSLVRQVASSTSSGLLVQKILSAANTTPVAVKASAAQIYGWQLVHTAAATRYVRIFNVASAPTMGTTSPAFVLPLPATGGAVLTPNDLGIPLSTGFYYRSPLAQRTSITRCLPLTTS
jgi:hypothetical protein